MDRKAQKPTSKQTRSEKRTEEVQQIIRDYVDDQLEILKKMHRHLN